MAIYKLIANGSFGPDEIEAMSALMKQTCMSTIGMRTYRVAPHMSAIGGKADMPLCTANVR